MNFTDDELNQFIAVYEQEFREKLTKTEAHEMFSRIVNLYMLLLKKLPSELEEEAKQRSSDSSPHTSREALGQF